VDELEQVTRTTLAGWGLTDAPEGAAALDIARRLGADDLRPAAAAMLHAQLRALLADLRKLAPEEPAADGVSDLQGEYEGLRVVGEP
jgi:hypothetical protein